MQWSINRILSGSRNSGAVGRQPYPFREPLPEAQSQRLQTASRSEGLVRVARVSCRHFLASRRAPARIPHRPLNITPASCQGGGARNSVTVPMPVYVARTSHFIWSSSRRILNAQLRCIPAFCRTLSQLRLHNARSDMYPSGWQSQSVPTRLYKPLGNIGLNFPQS